MKKTFLIITLLTLLSTVNIFCQKKENKSPLEKSIDDFIVLKPNTDSTRLSFFISSSWMEGPIELRFPETMQQNNEFYFIDHNAGIQVMENLNSKHEWKENPDSSLSYTVQTTNGLIWSGRVKSVKDGVELSFSVENKTSETIYGLFPQMCLTLSECKNFNQNNELYSYSTWSGGERISLAKTTPTQSELNRKFPWVIMLTKEGKNIYKGKLGRESKKNGWWIVNELADIGIIAKESADKKNLVAMNWVYSNEIITNTGIPCLHSVPDIHGINLEVGKKYKWLGKIYLMKNDPDSLLEKSNHDMKEFSLMIN